LYLFYFYVGIREKDLIKLGFRIHAVLDYLTIVLFAIAPRTLGLTGFAAVLSYTLAGAHFLVTVGSTSPLGIPRLLPPRVHGIIELAVGAVLLVLPWLVHFRGASLWFFVAAGGTIFIVFWVTEYAVVGAAAQEG
jgi:hypothetical protein